MIRAPFVFLLWLALGVTMGGSSCQPATETPPAPEPPPLAPAAIPDQSKVVQSGDLQPLATANWIGCRWAVRDPKVVLAVQINDGEYPFMGYPALVEVWQLTQTEGQFKVDNAQRLFLYRGQALQDVRLSKNPEFLLHRIYTSGDAAAVWGCKVVDDRLREETEIARGVSPHHGHSRFFSGVGAVGEGWETDLWLARVREEGGQVKSDKPISLGPGRSPLGLTLGPKNYLLALNVKSEEIEGEAPLDADPPAGGNTAAQQANEREVKKSADRLLQQEAARGLFWDRIYIRYDFHAMLDRRPAGPLVWAEYLGGVPKWSEVPGAKAVLEFTAVVTRGGQVLVACFVQEGNTGFALQRLQSADRMQTWSQPVTLYHTGNIPVMVDMIETEDRFLVAVVEQEVRTNPRMFLRVFSLTADFMKSGAAATSPAA
jgi:hypothetical protein